MNIVKQDNVIREIKSLPRVEKELLEYEFIDRNPSRVYVLDTDEEYFLSSLLSVLDNMMLAYKQDQSKRENLHQWYNRKRMIQRQRKAKENGK